MCLVLIDFVLPPAGTVLSTGARGTAPPLRTWLGAMMGVKYVLGSQEAISEACRLAGCRL